MGRLTSSESIVLDHLDGTAMLAQVEAWAAINSGSRNLGGLATMADMLSTAFAPLGGTLALRDPVPVTAIGSDGMPYALAHGRNLHVVVRPDAPVRVLLTGHMDTVFAIDHPFQACRWLDATTVNGPGTADMKGGIAVMLAALTAFEASPSAARLGYESRHRSPTRKYRRRVRRRCSLRRRGAATSA